MLYVLFSYSQGGEFLHKLLWFSKFKCGNMIASSVQFCNEDVYFWNEPAWKKSPFFKIAYLFTYLSPLYSLQNLTSFPKTFKAIKDVCRSEDSVFFCKVTLFGTLGNAAAKFPILCQVSFSLQNEKCRTLSFSKFAKDCGSWRGYLREQRNQLS